MIRPCNHCLPVCMQVYMHMYIHVYSLICIIYLYISLSLSLFFLRGKREKGASKARPPPPPRARGPPLRALVWSRSCPHCVGGRTWILEIPFVFPPQKTVHYAGSLLQAIVFETQTKPQPEQPVQFHVLSLGVYLPSATDRTREWRLLLGGYPQAHVSLT